MQQRLALAREQQREPAELVEEALQQVEAQPAVLVMPDTVDCGSEGLSRSERINALISFD